jgi:hypothetical protein
MPLLFENGGMCPVPLQGMLEGWMLVLTAAILRDSRDNEPPVSDENKANSYASVELDV